MRWGFNTDCHFELVAQCTLWHVGAERSYCCIPIRRGPAIVCASSHQLLLERLMFFLARLLRNQSIEKIVKPPTLLFSSVNKPYYGYWPQDQTDPSSWRCVEVQEWELPKAPHQRNSSRGLTMWFQVWKPTGCSTSSSDSSVNATTNIPWATVYRETYNCKETSYCLFPGINMVCSYLAEG